MLSSRKGDGATLTSLIGSAIERAEQVCKIGNSVLSLAIPLFVTKVLIYTGSPHHHFHPAGGAS